MRTFALALIAILGIVGMILVQKTLGEHPARIKTVIMEQCSNPENFSDEGVCIPKQPVVAVVINNDGEKKIIWGTGKIRNLPGSE